MVVENGRAAALAARTLARLVEGSGAVERTAADGGPVFSVETEHAVATVRVHEAPGVRVVSTFMSAKQRVHDTHGVFAYTASDSVLPHFSLDCSDRAEGQHAFHVDLLPRVELATAVAYLDEVYGPLKAAHGAADGIDGLTPAPDRSRRQALMSPWLLVHLATGPALEAVGPIVDAYADRWLDLLERGVSAGALASVAAGGVDLVARDALVRRHLCSPEVDPVWGRVVAMLGPDHTHTLQSHLLGTA